MNAHRTTNRNATPRRGYVSLLAVGALLVVLGVAALAVDRMWIDNASIELRAAADASALAAARALCSDNALVEDVDWGSLVERARTRALDAADLNPVADGRLVLRPGADGDVWFGRDVLNRETGQRAFVFTDWRPHVVKVRAERTRDTANPVRMLLSGTFGVPVANVSTYATVVVDNHVLGIRPGESLPVPALPIAIRADDVPAPSDGGGETTDDASTADTETTDTETTDTETTDAETTDAETGFARDSWANAIDDRRGPDELSWDADEKKVVRQPDGLPEIVVRPMQDGEKAGESNVHLLDFRSAFRFGDLEEQIEHGLTRDHLEGFEDGEMLLDGRHHRMQCHAVVDGRVFDMLARSIGRPRLCFLYEQHRPEGRDGNGTLDVVRLVAVRVLEVRRKGNGTEAVLQPTVVTTKTAIPFEGWEWGDEDAHRNPYVYRLTVTP